MTELPPAPNDDIFDFRKPAAYYISGPYENRGGALAVCELATARVVCIFRPGDRPSILPDTRPSPVVDSVEYPELPSRFVRVVYNESKGYGYTAYTEEVLLGYAHDYASACVLEATTECSKHWQAKLESELNAAVSNRSATPTSNLANKPAVQRIMDLARKFRSAPGDLYDAAYKELEAEAYSALLNVATSR